MQHSGLLGCDAASIGRCSPTFREDVCLSYLTTTDPDTSSAVKQTDVMSRNTPRSQETKTSIISQIDPIHAVSSYFFGVLSILSSHPRLGLPSRLFPSGFATNTLYTPLLSPIRATRPAHLILDLITRTIFGEQYSTLTL